MASFLNEHIVYIWLLLFIISHAMIVTKSLRFGSSSATFTSSHWLHLMKSEEDSISLFEANRGGCVCVGTYSQVRIFFSNLNNNDIL